MLLNRWLKTLSQPLALCRRTAPVRRRPLGWQQAAQLIGQIETLEDRTLLATFFVNNLADSGAGSLRDAIEQANLTPEVDDELEFTMAGSIQLFSALPDITDTLNLNGASIPGFAGTPLVEVDYNGFAGLTFATGSSGSVLRSLGHINASTAGVTLNADGILLVGNFIGLELDGNTIAGNIGGVLVNSNSNTIGQAGEPRNIISGNTGNGIWINGSTGNEIAGNYIGTDATGSLDRGNTLDGIRLENADDNLIGQNDPVTGITYDNADNVVIQPVSAWQGIRDSDTSGQFLIVGTSDLDGLLFDGTIEGNGTSFLVNYPEAASTSVYGPDNLNGDVLRLVGSYKNDDAMTAAVTVNGFLFEGTTAELGQSSNYRTINQPGAKFNYVHSTMGGLAVGNYDSELAHGTHSLPLGPGHAYIYDISQDAFLTDIMFPGALSNTAYGIWHNGETSYTIVGGYSLDPVNNFEDPEQPIGQAYIVDYNSATGLFSNWASFDYPNGTNFVTHFEGISSVEKGIYTLNADSAQIGSSNPAQGSFVSVSRNPDGTFGEATWVDLNFPGPDPTTNITSSNSVYGNQVVGVVIGPDSGFSFQATVNVGFQLSNVISGNAGNGIGLYSADDNQIAMNFIGTDITGNFDLGNSLSGVLVTDSSQGNLIGGSATGGNDPTNDVFARPPQGNLISGNDANGVLLTGNATLNVLSGNFIGTDVSGNSALGNSLDGVAIVNASGNSLIGCTIHNDPFVFYNVISGNGGNGLRVTDSNDTTIQANFFGMGADNNTALGNSLDGVLIEGSSARTLMGGPIPLGNVVTANAGNGIVVKDTASFFTSYNTFAGLAAFSDNLTFGNGLNGMLITSSGSEILIRTNVIARNGDNGIEISGDAQGVRVVGNIIGLNTNGTIAMGNVNHGVEIGGSASNIVIGGPQPTFNIIPYNVISANGASGVAVVDNAHNIQIDSSHIGLDLVGNTAFGNGEAGVFLGGNSHTTTIGSLDPDFLTVISGNLGDGVEIQGSTGNTVIGSLIGTGAAGLQSLPNAGHGISVAGGTVNTLIVTANTIEGGDINAPADRAGIRLMGTLPAIAVISIDQNFITGFPYAVNSDDLALGATVTVFNNSLAGNTVLEVRNGTGSGAMINASGNWWGSNTATGVAARVSGIVDYTPWLDTGIDTNLDAPGFQGSFDILHVAASGAQAGTVGRIQEGVNLVEEAGTVNVTAGTYTEDVLINKANLTVSGQGVEGPDLTRVEGVPGGDVATFRIAASGITLENFYITRQGNNADDWNDPALNSVGVAIQHQTADAIVQNNILFGNRTGIDVNNSNDNIIRNNLIDSNHTGLLFRNQTDNTTLSENFITNNRTVGVLFLIGAEPIQSAVNSTFFNNNISGNWYAQIVDRQEGGTLPAPGTTNLKNFSGNWFGTNSPIVTTNNSAEPGYALLIPPEFGGTAVAPGGQPDVAGPASANFDITPLLAVGTDIDPATFGFQGDFSTLHVTTLGAQTQVGGRINEAVGLVTEDGEVILEAGTFHETVTIDRTDLASFTLRGRTNDSSLYVIDAGGADAITITDPETVTIQDLRIIFASEGIVAMSLSTLNLSNLEIAASLSGGTLSNITNVHLTVTTLDDTFDVNDTQFMASGIPPISYTDVANLSLSSGDGNDTFNVGPLSFTLLTINGNAPTTSPGDTLNYTGPGVINSTGTGSGTITQTGFETVTFNGIETVSTGFVSVVTAPGPGSEPRVQVFDQFGEIRLSILAFDSNFQGGVRVTTGDMTGDGVPDIIAAAGPGGGPHVRIFDGVTGEQIAGPLGSFFAYNPGFAGGVFVALADLNGDLQPEIITGAGAGGGPNVRAFDGNTGALVLSFFAYDPNFTGGVQVAAGDVTGDNMPEIVTGAGPGGGPNVRTFDGLTGQQIAGPLGSFFAYDAGFTGGVYVAVADLNDDQRSEIITGAGAGGGPNVRAFDGSSGALVSSFFAYDPSFTGGVRVAAGDVTGDNMPEIITGPGPGGGPNVRTFNGLTGQQIAGPLGSFFAYDAGFTGGVYVAGVAQSPSPMLALGGSESTTIDSASLSEPESLESEIFEEDDEWDLDQLFADESLLEAILT